MAELLDEQKDVELQDDEQLGSFEEAEEPIQEEDTYAATEDEAEDDLPEKYKGKQLKEIVRMHQEAEKLLGRQSSEVGELRHVVDSYIQTQLDTTQQNQQPEEEIDFFSDPDKAVDKAIKNHPSIRQAEAVTNQYRQATAKSLLQERHPDMGD